MSDCFCVPALNSLQVVGRSWAVDNDSKGFQYRCHVAGSGGYVHRHVYNYSDVGLRDPTGLFRDKRQKRTGFIDVSKSRYPKVRNSVVQYLKPLLEYRYPTGQKAGWLSRIIPPLIQVYLRLLTAGSQKLYRFCSHGLANHQMPSPIVEAADWEDATWMRRRFETRN